MIHIMHIFPWWSRYTIVIHTVIHIMHNWVQIASDYPFSFKGPPESIAHTEALRDYEAVKLLGYDVKEFENHSHLLFLIFLS